jgi:hypothetical protein
MEPTLVLSCDGCIIGPSARCDDCLVTALRGDTPAHVDVATARAVRQLQDAQLLPPLRRVLG